MLKPKQDDYYQCIRCDVVDLVEKGTKRVLDVGCAFGITGELLKEKGIEEVVGIEVQPHACEEASKRLDKVIMGNVQDLTLPYKDGYFDCIIYADILEHLIDPWSVLKRQNRLLKKGGHVVASIPNVRHYRVIKKLKSGRWDYEEKGVLDSTHVRFFTLESIKKMFRDAGYDIERIEYKISASNNRKLLNKILRGRLNESLSEQFLVRAAKVSE